MTGLAQGDITRMRDQLFLEGPERNRRLSRFWLLLPLAAVNPAPGLAALRQDPNAAGLSGLDVRVGLVPASYKPLPG